MEGWGWRVKERRQTVHRPRKSLLDLPLHPAFLQALLRVSVRKCFSHPTPPPSFFSDIPLIFWHLAFISIQD